VTSLVGRDLGDLRLSLAGAVITSDDSEYDVARRCFNAAVDRRPAVIVRTGSTSPFAGAGTTPPDTAPSTTGS